MIVEEKERAKAAAAAAAEGTPKPEDTPGPETGLEGAPGFEAPAQVSV